MHFPLPETQQKRPKPPNLAVELARLGPVEVEFYSPHLVDVQEPHSRDELYVVAEGDGVLEVSGQEFVFSAGDVLYVPAHAEHTFTKFTDGFGAWVIFFGG